MCDLFWGDRSIFSHIAHNKPLAASLTCLLLIGCGSGSGSSSFSSNNGPTASGNFEPVPTATVTPLPALQNVDLTVTLAFTEPAEATRFTLEVFDAADGRSLAGPIAFQRAPGDPIPAQLIKGLSGSFFRVVVLAADADDRPLGSLDRTLPATSQQLSVNFSELPPLPPTREVGRISASTLRGDSNQPAISRDGRFVAFSSLNPGLIPGILNSSTVRSIYLRDRQSSTTQRIGTPGILTIPDGTSNIVFIGESGTLGVTDGTSSTILVGARDALDPDLSSDGRFLVYEVGSQITLFDRNRRPQERALTPTLAPAGTSLAQIIGGRDPAISENGRFVTYTASLSGQPDQIALYDQESLSTTLISKADSGALADKECANPILSPDGKLIFFSTTASNLPGGQGGLIVYDLASENFSRVSRPSPFPCSVSNDGRWVTANIDNRLRLIDRKLNTNIEVPGMTGFAAQGAPSISGDGRFITFYSNRSDLVTNDINGRTDVFVIDLSTSAISRVNVAGDGVAVQGGVDQTLSQGPVVSKDGNRIAYASPDDLLVAGDLNGSVDVFSSANPTGGKLYIALDGRILRFDNVATANGALTPAATLSSPLLTGTPRPELYLDTFNDRLYVAAGSASNGRLVYFDNVSTLNGNVVTTHFRGIGANSAGLFVDVGNNLLYRGNVLFSTATGLGNPVRTLTGETPDQLLVDTRYNEWILGGFGLLKIFPAGTSGASTPLRTLPTNLRNLRGLQFDASPVGLTTRNASNYFTISEGAPFGATPEAGFNALAQLTTGGVIQHILRGAQTGLGSFSATTIPGPLAVDAYTGHAYTINGADGRVLVFQSPTQDTENHPVDRVLTLPVIPKALVLDRTR